MYDRRRVHVGGGKPYIRYSGGGIWGTDEVNGVNVAKGGGD